MAAEEGSAGGAGPQPAPGQEEAAKKNPKVQWSKEEDDMLRELVRQHGDNCWRSISGMMIPGRRRSGKSCRNRWTQHLDPSRRNTHIRKPPRCLRLFPVTPGFHHQKQAAQAEPPLAFAEDDAAGPGRPGALPECIQLFPLAPGDAMDNDGKAAATAAATDVDSEAVRSFTELRLALAEVLVFDAMPLQVLRT